MTYEKTGTASGSRRSAGLRPQQRGRFHHACVAVANLQLFRAIWEFGDQALEDMLRANPGSYLNPPEHPLQYGPANDRP